MSRLIPHGRAFDPATQAAVKSGIFHKKANGGLDGRVTPGHDEGSKTSRLT
jgi:hypothetical protein